MSREIKRVPLDFAFPIDDMNDGGENWPGYLRDCGDEDCEGCPECERVDPPTGEGWQLWQTTSEGSPLSPVFATGEDLAAWISENPVGFAGARISLETARRWVHGPGWSPSMAVVNGQLIDGITYMADRQP